MAKLHKPEYHIDASRTGLVSDIGSTVPQVPFEFFKANILPKLHHGIDTAKVVAALKEAGGIKDSRWAAFPKDPRDYKDNKKVEENEAAVFTAMGDVVAAIIRHSGVHDKVTTVEYASTPYCTPICDYVKKNSKPDAFMLFRTRLPPDDGEQRVYWRDLCCIAEFKLGDTAKDMRDVSLLS